LNGTLRIALADDHGLVRQGLRALLEKLAMAAYRLFDGSGWRDYCYAYQLP
jgi:DNA-binding NarL/FixJ family response regulator